MLKKIFRILVTKKEKKILWFYSLEPQKFCFRVHYNQKLIDFIHRKRRMLILIDNNNPQNEVYFIQNPEPCILAIKVLQIPVTEIKTEVLVFSVFLGAQLLQLELSFLEPRVKKVIAMEEEDDKIVNKYKIQNPPFLHPFIWGEINLLR